MAANKNQNILLDFRDAIDDLGRLYMVILFVSGAVWAFIAINNLESQSVFKAAMIYSILLIFGFLGVSYDRRAKKLGLDSRIWENKNIKKKIAIATIFFIGWYLLFMSSGFNVATAQSVGGVAFSLSPTLNFLLITVLGPLAENIFFFGVLNITFIVILRRFTKNNVQGLVVSGLIFSTGFLFDNVPNAFIYTSIASALVVITTITQHKLILKHAPIFVSALFIGGVIFPAFHGYAYQLKQSNYIAATWFGIFMCLMAAYIGMMPVDIAHIANNVVAVGG